VNRLMVAGISRAELEGVFPWVRFLPDEAARQFAAIIDDYHEAAEIWARDPAA
jgi:hypothetical protein